MNIQTDQDIPGSTWTDPEVPGWGQVIGPGGIQKDPELQTIKSFKY